MPPAETSTISTISNVEDNASTGASKAAEGNEKTPGFSIISGAVCLFCISLLRIKER